MDISPRHQQILLDTARSAIIQSLRGQQPQMSFPAGGEDPLLNLRAGCFVSLHDATSHRLRGCVGRLQSPDPLVRGIFETAISCLNDPRFTSFPVTLNDLPRLTLEISVLSPLQPAASVLDFDPKHHGIYLTIAGRTGTFLPQVGRDTGWSREQLLSRLCSEKMGLTADSWKLPDARLLTYQAVVIGPVPFLQAPPPRPGGLSASGNVFHV